MPGSIPDPSPESLADSVTRNACDFMRMAIDELEPLPGGLGTGTHPIQAPPRLKASLLHFCTAVELFLKARLMREHWALVVQRPEQAEIDQFAQGRQPTAGLKDVIERLAKVARAPLTATEKKAFLDLSEHRNRLVHFFDERYAEVGTSDVLRETIAAEQCRAWYHLHELLVGRWREHFLAQADEIAALEDRMHLARAFLDVKYEALKPEIDRSKEDGILFRVCPFCRHEAVRGVGFYWPAPIEEHACLVCRIPQPQRIRARCVNTTCGAGLLIREAGVDACHICGTLVGIAPLVEQLSTAGRPAICSLCAEYAYDDELETVAIIGAQDALCVRCFSQPGVVFVCDRCGMRVAHFVGDTPTCRRCRDVQAKLF